ncbi:hypothetical protein FHG68_14030 [Leptospira weilii]|nr:hypothetical protein FHG68_14030 [Leptospira weilii]
MIVSEFNVSLPMGRSTGREVRRLIRSRCTLVFYSPKLSTFELTLIYGFQNVRISRNGSGFESFIFF